MAQCSWFDCKARTGAGGDAIYDDGRKLIRVVSALQAKTIKNVRHEQSETRHWRYETLGSLGKLVDDPSWRENRLGVSYDVRVRDCHYHASCFHPDGR
jgi:hypothetical protein